MAGSDFTPLPEPYAITPPKSRKIKLAVEGICELCLEQHPLSYLELHHLFGEADKDLQKNILILCHICHRHVHAMPVPVEQQRTWLNRRPYKVRKMIRTILGYQLEQYIPPETVDFAQLYEDAFKLSSLASFRLAG